MIQDHLKYKIEDLSEDERRLLAIKIKAAISSKAKVSTTNSQKRIVAYVKSDDDLDEYQMKSFLKSKLPDYMVPSSIKVLDHIPLLPNGKVDKKELLKIKDNSSYSESNQLDVATPKNEIETKLVKIWEAVLGFSPISTSDNFFEIGGDSILSIQIVAKARKEGVNLKANQLFENQTIAELAMFSNLSDDIETQEDHIEFEGETPLTPVQHWFFETHKTAPHFWNQAIELQHVDSVSSKIFKNISNQLITNHEAFRLSFTNNNNNNNWTAIVKPSKQIESFHHFDLDSTLNKAEQDEKIQYILLDIQKNIDLSEGNLFKIIFFNCNTVQSNKVIIVAHHLVIDLVSWRIITSEINQAIKNSTDNFIVDDKKNKTANIKDWSDYLENTIKKNLVENELDYWKSQIIDKKAFPKDRNSESKTYFEDSVFYHTTALSMELTDSLIHEANTPFNTKVEDLLIAVVIKTLCEWADLDQVLLGLERQGRNIDTEEIDVSNTAGWFTSFFPITLELNKSENLGYHIKAIKEKLRAIPNNGLGFGVLKYLTHISELNHLNPKVIFNYLGNTNAAKNTEDLNFNFIESNTRDPKSERHYEIEINAQIINKELTVNWSFPKDLYNENTAQTLANTFNKNAEALIDYCKTQGGINYTPSDFPEADLNQDDLDNLLNQF